MGDPYPTTAPLPMSPLYKRDEALIHNAKNYEDRHFFVIFYMKNPAILLRPDEFFYSHKQMKL